MRTIQVVIFAIGVLSFLISALYIGQEMGDTLWRVGVAAMLIDLAYMRLWSPTKSV